MNFTAFVSIRNEPHVRSFNVFVCMLKELNSYCRWPSSVCQNILRTFFCIRILCGRRQRSLERNGDSWIKCYYSDIVFRLILANVFQELINLTILHNSKKSKHLTVESDTSNELQEHKNNLFQSWNFKNIWIVWRKLFRKLITLQITFWIRFHFNNDIHTIVHHTVKIFYSLCSNFYILLLFNFFFENLHISWKETHWV